MCSQLAVCVWRICISVASRRDDGRALDAGLKTLLTKSDLLEFGKAILLSGTVDGRVLEKFLTGRGQRRMEESRRSEFSILGFLNLPCVFPLVEDEARVVIAFVEELED